MSKTIDFIFDFGSPNAYLAWQILPGIAARSNAQVNLIPCLLGGLFKLTGNQAPMTAFGNVKGKLEYERLETQRSSPSTTSTPFASIRTSRSIRY
jgi:2-hydroxychromene-2-carboxylate isomerase